MKDVGNSFLFGLIFKGDGLTMILDKLNSVNMLMMSNLKGLFSNFFCSHTSLPHLTPNDANPD